MSGSSCCCSEALLATVIAPVPNLDCCKGFHSNLFVVLKPNEDIKAIPYLKAQLIPVGSKFPHAIGLAVLLLCLIWFDP